MERQDHIVVVLIGILLALGAGFATAATAMAQTESRNANGFTVASASFFVAAVFVFVVYFLLYPALVAAARRRHRWLATPPPPIPRATRNVNAAPAPPLTIDEAWYGAVGHDDADRSAQITAKVRDGRLDFDVTNEEVGLPDPVPNVVKRLRILYRVGDSEQREAFFGEGERAVLPPESL